uniref:Putative ovule protein n=1 Tax=Solanum chacoense TaxID=4108 RepID=A0A0V0H328_SOLCH
MLAKNYQGKILSSFANWNMCRNFQFVAAMLLCVGVLSSLSPDLLCDFFVSLLYLCFGVFSHYLHFSPYSEKLLNYLLYYCTQVFK